MAAIKKIRYDENQHKSWVKKIQGLKNQGAGFELMALRALLDFEKTPIAWKSPTVKTFMEMLKTERLFPVSRYMAFKRATLHLKPKVIDSLGVQAACLIGAQPPRSHFGLISKARSFRSRHGVDATYQYITEILKKRRPKKRGPQRAQLLKYILVLKDEIVTLGGKPSPEPWV